MLLKSQARENTFIVLYAFVEKNLHVSEPNAVQICVVQGPTTYYSIIRI